MKIVEYERVESKILTIRHQHVIMDSDVAELYGVETKRINEAVKNNPEKFPDGYLFALSKEEWEPLKSKFSTSIKGGKVKPPTAFTERGLYMLATILKSQQATATTLSIIDTFSKVREIERSVKQLAQLPEGSPKQKTLLHKTGELLADLIQPDDASTTGSEASIEPNLALIKFKYTIKKNK